MNQTADNRQAYLDTVLANASGFPARGVSWVDALREHARNQFATLGFPSARDEDWKYTNINPIERERFKPVPKALNGVSAAQLEAMTFHGLEAHRLVFVNGYYHENLSAVGALPVGVTAGSLAEALKSDPALLEPYLGRYTPIQSHAFAALNSAYLVDGAYLQLAPGATSERPIHLVYVTTGQTASSMTQPRTLIVAHEGARATVIEHYVTLTDARYFTNALTEVIAEPGANIEHYRLQQESVKAFHVGGLHVHLAQDSRFTGHAIDLGGQLVRNDVRGLLDATGAECELNGLYVVDGRGHVDNHTHIDHAKPHGTSRELYKGVLDGRARAVFSGRVVVHPDAQHTDAQQMNKNLLLSRDAEVDTKPQLEIYADDVKCSHGATVGQLDHDVLFYLRTRAVDEAAARDLLTYAFANDVLHRIRLAPMRVQLEHTLTARLLHGRSIRELELV
jgi:Fe-S cluster assembly protein SufD